ncbi:MAG: FkbM family methyltransferase [Prochloraceae cyanobacterium]|nr:FkbM family methyltransferase [Prochloraceae cyanobacterium]
MFISYAQNFEDVMLNRIFKDKESGFYIDIGAHHPVYDSVTKSFYDRGWQGINIEPVKEFFTLLQQERDRDINLNIAIGESRSNLEFFELEGSGFSTLDGETAMKLAEERGLKLSQYQVPVRTLADVCREHLNSQIDFLKIDVEGWEEKVILGNDWEAFRPTIIILEATLPGSPIRKENNICNFLEQKGYQRVYFDGLNDYYLAEEASSLATHLDTPPNVFDNFIPFQFKDPLREITILKNNLNDEKLENQHLTQAVVKLKSLQNQRAAQITQLYAQIAAMESSKFWKMRSAWFDFKRMFGIFAD